MIQSICITGADGFIGRNLCLYLSESKELKIIPVTRKTNRADLEKILKECDVVIHLAGVNRPLKENEYTEGNSNFTEWITNFLTEHNRNIPFIFTSSTQAVLDNPYGISKKLSEEAVIHYKNKSGGKIAILRLPGVFGKFCKPNYNSVVATFCYNISRGIEIQVNDPEKEIELVYIDNVIFKIEQLISELRTEKSSFDFIDIQPVFKISLQNLANTIKSFHKTRLDLSMVDVGIGLTRALYATYISYLPNSEWSYEIPKYSDTRGVFVEMIKTKESGQFSYFTAKPGVTRGEHYHHTKTEKFLVIKGDALFRFRNKITDESQEIKVSGDTPTIVDTIPGWAHDITNIGKEEMIVMLWANEIFDRNRPDTYSSAVLK